MQKCGKVYIIGFMGSGKTTVGRRLANLMEWSFTDLDKEIEEKEKRSINDIFSSSGEEYFRNAETSALKELSGRENFVISTGGGTPCFGDNMKFMNETGITVYLKLTPSQLASRLEGGTAQRPLVRDLDKNSMIDFITGKLEERESFYEMADIIVDGFSLNTTRLSEQIRKML